jgi:tetratricopeptide (TPR) repeat protein
MSLRTRSTLTAVALALAATLSPHGAAAQAAEQHGAAAQAAERHGAAAQAAEQNGAAAQAAGGSAPTDPRAQGAPDPDQRARSLFHEGRTAFDEARYADAYRAFEEAYRLSERPALLINMSRALEAQGKSREAADALVHWLAVADPDAQERELVEARRARLEAQAEQDEQTRAAALRVQPTAPAPTPIAPPPPVLPPRRDLPRWLRVGLWTGAGTLAASGITLIALGRHDIRDVETPSEGARWQGVADDYERGPRLVGAGIALGAGALACAVTAAVLEWRGLANDRPLTLTPLGARGSF